MENYKLLQPIITYKKWWHRFIPYYRKNIRVMNDLLEYKFKDPLFCKELENKILNDLLN